MLFEKETAMTPEILKWVLGYGIEVQVTEPEELKEEVIREAEGMLEKY